MKRSRFFVCALALAIFVSAGADFSEPLNMTAAFAGSTTVCEDFESGYTLGAELRTHPDWFYEDANSGPILTSGIGVDGSIGLSNGDRAFAWVAQEFNWNDPLLIGVWFQMDYQTDASGVFDDDRLGWTISDSDDNSDWIFGVQMDPGGGGAGGNIETYWDGDSLGDDGGRYSIVDLPALSGNTWYRLRGEFTKLTSSSARIDVTLWQLNASGDTVGQVVSGTIADTDLLPDTPGEEIPNPAYFTATSMWPVYKNFDNTNGAADNACFGIITQEAGPYSLTLTIVGSGDVDLDPSGGIYDAGTVVKLAATSDSGWIFSGWSGHLTGNANPDSITMDGDKDVTATFVSEPSGAVICEDFESGFTLGQTVGSHSEWFDNGSGPVVNSGLGVGGSVGLAPGTAIFIWTEHPFSWTAADFQGYHVQMDFQTDASGHLDDDRVGWMITDDDVESSNIFGVQCDPGGSGYNIEGYWDGMSSDDRRPSIVDLPTLSANSWYQLRAAIAKLTATSASIDVALIELDASGDSVSLVATGSIPNTAALGDDAPNSKYFTGPVWPAYKNYTTAGANADNACFQVLTSPLTYTLTVNIVGSGSVELDPPGGLYGSGTEVELTAMPDSGWVFSGWSVDLSGSANPETLAMSGNMTVMATFAPSASGTYMEDFESGFTLGVDIGEHPDWFDGADTEGSNVTAGIGLLSSIGLAPGDRIFTWTAHPFSWNDPGFQKLNLQMDFQTDPSGQFDDDRLGWMITDEDYASENCFGVQLDHSDGGIVTYWRDSTGTRIQDQIVDISGLPINTWFRFRAEITKLAATQARIDVSLVQLDGSGNPTGTPFTGTVANTSSWLGGAPDNKYFTAGAIWPAYKNFQDLEGAADNAYAQIVTTSGALSPGDVVIAGLQAWNSVGSQDPAEFVELFNTTSEVISLENMELISRVDNDSDGLLEIDWELSASLSGKSIAPHSFFLIAESGVAAEGGVRDVPTDLDLATGEGGAAERAISLELVIDGAHMDYVVYGRDDGQNPVGEMPPGDIPFDSTGSWPRAEVCRNTRGTASFQEGLLRRQTVGDLYAGYAVNGYYTDEGSLGQGYPSGIWYSSHDETYDGYQARSSASASVPPPVNHPPEVTLVSPWDDAIDVSVDPELRVNVTDDDDDTSEVTFYGREKSAGENFTLIPIPDTQKYSESYPWIYYDQMQFIVDSMDVWNIVFAAHEGDIVEHYGTQLEWMRADTAMSILEDPVGTGLPEGIPYSVLPGNHDQPTTYYNTYFGVSRFSGRSYYGGHDGSTNDNNYCFFSAGGMDFIVISLEYNPGSSQIAWADSLLAAYPNRRGILATHYILNTNGSWGGQGQTIYDTLKDNPNLDLMLCGHMHGEALRTEVYNGDTTHVILADYQDITSGGNGWLRIMEFQPANNRIRVLTYSPYLDQYGTDTYMGDDTISEEFFLSYNMSSKGAFTTIGTVDDVASGEDAFLTWSGRTPGTEYEWYVKALDGIDTTTSLTWSFTTLDTVPQCTLSVNTVGNGEVILSPPGGIYNCGTDVVLTADPDPGWEFDRWSGALTGSQNPDTLTLSGNKAVTAIFEEIPWIGWTEKFPNPHPTARAYSAMACLEGGQVVLFGGWNGSTIVADTWVYDVGESTWTQMSPATAPSARAGHAMAHIGGDQVLLFGGDDGSYDNETWVYDLSANTWTQKNPATKPSARADFDMAYVGGDQVVLFGGNDGSKDDETWVYDLSANTWTKMSPTTKPSARAEHAMAHLGGDRALLFGGNDGTYDDETWVYDLSANTWTNLSPTLKPSARATLTMAHMGGDQVLLFGGDDGSYDDQTWIYDLGENTWTEQAGTPHPSARYAYAMCESEMDGSSGIVLFGGYHGTMSDETWLFGGEGQYEPPQAVQSLQAVMACGTSAPGSQDICLVWSAVTADTAGSPMTVDYYVIYRDIVPGFNPDPGKELGATAETSYVDVDAAGQAGVNYFYYVMARKDDKESDTSACVGQWNKTAINHP